MILAGIRIFSNSSELASFVWPSASPQANRKNMNRAFSYGYNTHSNLESQSSTPSNYILEKYIYPPFLLDRRKFSLGVYCIITSVEPLVVWFCEDEILILLAIEPFDLSEIEKKEMHLTNGNFLKMHPRYNKTKNRWNKKTFLQSIGIYRYNKILTQVKQNVAAIVSAFGPSWKKDKSAHPSFGETVFGFWRFDFLIDADCHVFLLEIETLPSTAPASSVTAVDLKRRVLRDMLQIAGWGKRGSEIEINEFDKMYSRFLTWASDKDLEINNTSSESLYNNLHRFEQQLRFSGSYIPLLQTRLGVGYAVDMKKRSCIEKTMQMWYLFHKQVRISIP